MLIKVCGLTDSENIRAIANLAVDMLGFIFYPQSSRYVVGRTPATIIKHLPVEQIKVGVFVNETFENMMKTAEDYGLQALQLHGNETPETCSALRGQFKVLKAFSVLSHLDMEQTKNYENTCHYFLFDTKGPSHGGNGVPFNWNILEAYSGDTPFMLSGGISAGDAYKISQIKHPKLAGIDLNSCFETSPGIKNPVLLEQFIKAFDQHR
jgi:phosphoribosylanthranilate isomerase